tara:strand:+ start:44 stop:211 length:168 start_codon:yes stop_codon:yes gene_type:complete
MKKNKIMVDGGMCLIIGGIMYTGYLETIIFPVAGIISCGVCLSICGLLGMISKDK